MRVKFEYTLDDVVDVQLRALKRSAVARAWRWRDLVATSVLSGALLFALIPGEMASRLIVGAVGLLLGALFYPVVSQNTLKRRLRKLFQENAGAGKVFICEIELCESGVNTLKLGTPVRCRTKNAIVAGYCCCS